MMRAAPAVPFRPTLLVASVSITLVICAHAQSRVTTTAPQLVCTDKLGQQFLVRPFMQTPPDWTCSDPANSPVARNDNAVAGSTAQSRVSTIGAKRTLAASASLERAGLTEKSTRLLAMPVALESSPERLKRAHYVLVPEPLDLNQLLDFPVPKRRMRKVLVTDTPTELPSSTANGVQAIRSMQVAPARLTTASATQMPEGQQMMRASVAGRMQLQTSQRMTMARLVLFAPQPGEPGMKVPLALAPSAASYDDLIINAAKKYGQEPNLLRAIAHVESRFNPNAVSSKGAIGLMQVMPDTALGMGVANADRALFEPSVNIETGAKYLKQLSERFASDTRLMVAAYNAGEGAVSRHNNAVPPYRETQNYVRMVMDTYDRLNAVH